MRLHPVHAALAALVGAGILSCKDAPTAPVSSGRALYSAVAAPQLGISQIYGGGGNANATLKNDFIEVFNPGTSSVSVTGWSVQYASAAGTTWQVTALTGTIAAGGYYLVQESQGTGGTQTLPPPEASGTIAMSATAGKVALVHATGALSGTCPAATDIVSFGTTATDCGFHTTPTLGSNNNNATFRKDAGCQYTGDLLADFSTAVAAPRNSASPTHTCPVVLPLGPLDHVAVAGGGTVLAGNTVQLSATPQDANGQTVPTATITSWVSSDPTIASVDATGKVTGVSANLNPVTITATAIDGALTATGTAQVTVNSLGINWLDVSYSATALVPGFQSQVFLTARVASAGTEVPATFFVEAIDPDLLTAQNLVSGTIVTAVSAPANTSIRPRIRITATPVGGGTPYVFTTGFSTSVPIDPPVAAPLSFYAINDEFGDPTPASTSTPNDLLIVRPQYTLSYNQSRGTPNWVSYELDTRHIIVGTERCNCFTADPNLPADKQIYTSDYTNGGYDRGHMTRSLDRTPANLDNAATFYLTNVVPQLADLNQGVWARHENALGDSATKDGRAVYIITGPLYSASHGLTFLKGEGKVAIPDSTWKVAFIGPRHADGTPFTLANVQTWDELAGITVIAVNMPNVSGIRNDSTSKYLTTVDKIEAATGLNFLSLLPVAFQDAVEAGDRAPVAHLSFGGSLNEGTQVTFDASASTDPDLGRTDLGRTEALTYLWQFGDGMQATGKIVSHVFSHGSYTATLTVSDAFGWQKTASQSVAIVNIAPTATFTTPDVGVEGSSLTLSLIEAFDPSPIDAATLRYSFDCGAGFSAPSSSSNAICTPGDNGTLSVRGRVIDSDNAFSEYVAVINIANATPIVSLTATSSLSILSGESVSAAGSFTDPGADAPWGYSFNWGAGANTTGSLAASGANTTATRQYFGAGSYIVTFAVTDKDGAIGTSTLTVTVGRREVEADVKPKTIRLKREREGKKKDHDDGEDGRDIRMILTSSTIDLSKIDIASVRIGSVGVDRDRGRYEADLSRRKAEFKFDRGDLIDAGLLTPATTEFVLTATLQSGVQIVARGEVTVREAGRDGRDH